MSDMYLVLRSRLHAVPDWVYIDTAVLENARKRRGLSYETMARTLPVSSKTWERYEKAGRIPRPLVAKVADALGLEIEEPVQRRITPYLDGGDPATLERLVDQVGHLQREVADVAALLRELFPDRP